MAETQTYNHDDIQRYLQQKMTVQEMHDFEKALMNDPFLADAFEGFSASDATLTEKHLSEIENKLTFQKEGAKLITLPLHKKAWWKVAAVLLVVAGGGILSYSLFIKKDTEKNIVQQMPAKKAAAITKQEDSVRPDEKPLAKASANEQSQAKNHNFRFNQPKKKISINYHEQESKIASVDNYTSKEYKKDTTFSRDIAAATTPSASFKSANSEREVKKMMLSQNASVTANDNNRIENNKLSHAGDASSNVEIKLKTANSTHLKNKIANTAKPSQGWKNFEYYLNNQIDSLKINSTENTAATKETKVEFFVNEQGEPTEVKVTPDPDTLYSRKIIEILNNGPRWKDAAKGEKVTLFVVF